MRIYQVFLLLLVAALAGGCQTFKPEAEVVNAIKTVDRDLAEYVRESNAALAQVNHPDEERLTGIGDRLRRAVGAVSDWVQEIAE